MNTYSTLYGTVEGYTQHFFEAETNDLAQKELDNFTHKLDIDEVYGKEAVVFALLLEGDTKVEHWDDISTIKMGGFAILFGTEVPTMRKRAIAIAVEMDQEAPVAYILRRWLNVEMEIIDSYDGEITYEEYPTVH